MHRLFAWGIILVILFSWNIHALAEENALLHVSGGREHFQVSADEPEDPAAGYINQKLYPARPTARGKQPAGASLTGAAQVLYTRLMADVCAVAAGEETSTVFVYPVQDIFPKWQFTAEELEVNALITVDETSGEIFIFEEAKERIGQLCTDVFSTALSCLVADAPYELYWYDRSIGTNVGYPFIGYEWDPEEVLYLTGDLTFEMFVSGEYAPEGAGEAALEVDPKYGTGVTRAAAKAREIVEANEKKPAYERLAAYRDEICRLTSYNDEAASGNMAYGNPWQLIWVFDENPETNVVCEGYAKAFKYLNDLSVSTDVSVICVTGQMEGGAHMWNVVNMDNGKNYMADITNCDEEMIGYPDKLFLAGYSDGSVAEGYTYTAYGWPILYVYQDNPFPDDALEIWDKSYLESLALKPDTPVYSLSSDTGYAGYRCAVRMDAPYDAVHILETGETLIPDSDGWFVVSAQTIGEEDVTFTIAAEREGFISSYGETLTLAAGTLPDTGLNFPDDLEEIEQEAFRGDGVTSAVFPESIRAIGAYAFADNPELKLIELNGQQVGDGAFDNCPQAVYCIDEEDIGQYFEEGIRFLVKE